MTANHGWTSNEERPSVHGAWHREHLAAFATMTDLDNVEACAKCARALLLIEWKSARSGPMREWQRRTVVNIAEELRVGAWEVRYSATSDEPFGPDDRMADRVQVTDMRDGRTWNITAVELANRIEDIHAQHHGDRHHGE